MAEISNTAVFTNDVVTSSATSDLLQQAFQQVVDEDEHENEFVAFLQNDENESQTIHLTPAQAAALGLTFEVNASDEVTYEPDQEHAIANEQENPAQGNNVSMEDADALVEQLDFKVKNEEKNCNDEIDYERWHVQNPSDGQVQNETVETNASLDKISLRESQNNVEPVESVVEQQNNVMGQSSSTQSLLLQRPKNHTLKTDEACFKEINTDEARYTLKGNIAQMTKMNTISNSQAQILQKLPVILPSQFIIKPAQTILKPTKSVRLLQNPAKLIGSIDPSSQSIGINSNSNSILLSKAALLNATSPQIVKATPIAAQLVSASNISAHLLNNQQIIAGPCQITTHRGVNTSHISNAIIGSASGSTQNVVTSQIRFSPVVKTAQTTLQRGQIQQFLTPVLKSSTGIAPKSGQTLSGANIAPAISAQFVKSIQVPAQLIKAAASSNVKKTSIISTAKTNVNLNSTTLFRASPIMKTQDLKSASSSPTSVLKSTQLSTAPISILKPQTKIAYENSNKQKIIVNAQCVGSYVSSLSQKSPVLQQTDTTECTTPLQSNCIKQKYNSLMNGANGKIGKKIRNISAVKKQPILVGTDVADTSKPLGSSENPIQIVQQGQTFHSVQRLTQAQLKQIAHVLQQRSQEAAASNERIVYRVVFPEELDLRIRSPGNILKSRGGKRGRPKKNAIKSAGVSLSKPTSMPDEDHDETKDERKKVVARTRSGRLSRPPRHMVRDYKHLHHLDFSQPDLDDSDGGYSDYNTNSDKLEDEETSKELLAGLEVPKRKISDHFRCPTCNKIYLGRTRMARHFEMHPDHGSPEQLPPSTPPPEIKQNNGADPLKRKGKKRGPWAYVTPEAKSERRQVKLKEAISVCEDLEIIKIAAKPVLNAQSLFDLLLLKSENNVRNFLNELKQLMNKIRERVGIMLTLVNGEGAHSKDVIDINEELLCDALGLNPGMYRIHDDALKVTEQPAKISYENGEPPLKLQKMDNADDGKENMEERMSSGFSESSDLSVSEFLNDKKNESITNPSCPEVLSALTLMRRNPSPTNGVDGGNKSNAVSKLLISNPEIQSQISETAGFQKIDIGASNVPNLQKLQKLEPVTEGFTKLDENVTSPHTDQVFEKLHNNYEEKLDHLEDAFIKLEPIEQGFVKMDSNTIGSYQKQNLDQIRSGMEVVGSGSQTFAKGFQKLVSKIIPPIDSTDLNCEKADSTTTTTTTTTSTCSSKILNNSVCKMSDGLSILSDTVPIISGACDNNIFENSENLDMTKISQYDHIAHLDILNTSGAIDKNLLIDEKLVEQLHLVDQTNLVDELVSERLKNIMPDTMLESNLIPNATNLEADLDFDALSEEFNRNTRS